MPRKRNPHVVGSVFIIVYPFVRDTYESQDIDTNGDGTFSCDTKTIPTWRPGTRAADKGEGDVENIADALGKMILTVIGVYQPSGFPTRVFFTRAWIDPDGKSFGKNNCRILTSNAFTRRTWGFSYRFVLKDCTCAGCQWPHEDHRAEGRNS